MCKKGHTPWNKGKKGLQIAWNKGLNKDTNESLRKSGKKISEYRKGIWKNKTYEEIYGIEKAKEIKKNRSNIQTLRWQNPEYRKKQCNSMKGHIAWQKGLNKHNDERVLKISKSISKSLRGKSFEQVYGHECSVRLRKKISKRQKKRLEDPLYRQKLQLSLFQSRISKGIPHGKRIKYQKKNGDMINLRSSFEFGYAVYLDLCNKQWEYENDTFILPNENNSKITYTPDFYVYGDGWKEVKGYWRDNDSKKKYEETKKILGDKLQLVYSPDVLSLLENIRFGGK